MPADVLIKPSTWGRPLRRHEVALGTGASLLLGMFAGLLGLVLGGAAG